MPRRTAVLKDVVGKRGEQILMLCLTDYQAYSAPLFNPGFLGDKWPVVDFYVEVLGSRKRKPFFLAQAKATSRPLEPTHVCITSKKRDIQGLRKIPGPTYMFAIHEPTKRVFVKAVHSGTPVRAITRIARANELTPIRLKDLRDEVNAFWSSKMLKPTTSAFL
jgi:hypothetical protein